MEDVGVSDSARSYNAEYGRFMQRDPAEMTDGPDMYIYVLNDPINNVDSSGMAVDWAYCYYQATQAENKAWALYTQNGEPHDKYRHAYVGCYMKKKYCPIQIISAMASTWEFWNLMQRTWTGGIGFSCWDIYATYKGAVWADERVKKYYRIKIGWRYLNIPYWATKSCTEVVSSHKGELQAYGIMEGLDGPCPWGFINPG